MKNGPRYHLSLEEAWWMATRDRTIQIGTPMSYVRHPDTPEELWVSIQEFWPEEEWGNATWIAWMESRFDAFAVNDTTGPDHPCGSFLRRVNGVDVYAEDSLGYFQINACYFPEWPRERLFNGRHNAGTAHLLWDEVGGSWKPWFLSASALSLL